MPVINTQTGELLLVAVLSIPGFLGGVGILKRRRYARILLLVLGTINLVSFPALGTILGVYTIWVLHKHESLNPITYQLIANNRISSMVCPFKKK